MDASLDLEPTRRPRHPVESARELLAHAWLTIGFPPLCSALLVTLGAYGEPGLVARVDLPVRPEHVGAVAASLVAAARAEKAGSAVLVVVQPARVRRPLVLVRAERALVRGARTGLRQTGVSVADVLVVGADRFRSVLCADVHCCPPKGLELGDLRSTVTGTALVHRGRSLVADEAALVADVEPRPWPSAVVAGRALSAPASLERWRALLGERLDADVPLPDPRPEEVAWLVPALADLRFRDAALVSLLPGAADLADDLAAGRVRGPMKLGRAETAPPDTRVFEAGRSLLAAVARGAAPGHRAEALAVMAWATWWSGTGARARLLVAMALADVPGHRLAVLVDQLLVRVARPPWIGGVPSRREVS